MTKRKTSKKAPRKGIFKPRNPKKYLGDVSNIVYRSSWELKVMQYLDQNTNVVDWSSEEIAIPYMSPVDNRVHRYYPDMTCTIKTAQGQLKKYLLEIKPHKETLEPVAPTKPSQKYIKECMTYGVNQAKWKNARLYCEKLGWEFRVITEYELGLKRHK